MLLAASYLFYGWWDMRFLYLIAASTVLDFLTGLLIGRGRVDRRGAIWSAGWLLGAAVVFVGIDWSTMSVNGALGVWTVAGSAGMIVVGWLFYPRLRAMEEQRRRRWCLFFSMAGNLGILGFFKYFNFFADSAVTALHSVGLDVLAPRLDILLPVGISFYTFQTMSYTIDVYRGELEPTDRFLDFALYVSYFPQLVAGPIERASHLLPRLLEKRTLNADQFARGCFLILFGLFKKVAIADGLAPCVDAVFALHDPTFGDVTLGVVCFAFQIYCDFSGYTDIARGCGKLMGIDIMLNFNLPYFASNPREFWTRWHISLSTWLRDYLYIPLGGNRHGNWNTYRNLMITMLLGGLWHGAAWNFVLWGFFHGLLLCVHRAIVPRNAEPARGVRQLLYMAGFFLLTCYGWLLFRARSFEQIVTMSATLLRDLGDWTISIPQRPAFSATFGLSLLLVWEAQQYLRDQQLFYRRIPLPIRAWYYAAVLFFLLMGLTNAGGQFIYFQF
ncbi:MAG: MBOAT family protein [Phycisphaeraceae bacterium]|nr:MBOAT family protein [Phycisphaeraceae bacterium]